MSPERHEIHSLRKESKAAMIAEAFGISKEEIQRLSDIARIVGGDWGMRVELGEPGKGSFFDETHNRIQFDPMHLTGSEKVKTAEFIAAHEGGHRLITRGPTALGLSEEKTKELYSQVGFSFGGNALEDPADNDWWARKYEGLSPIVNEIYDEMLKKDAAVLGTPEIHEAIARLGSVPRFAHFGSEVIRYWHTGTFSKGIPDDVRQALERTREAMSDYFKDIPESHPHEQEVLEHARGRFLTYLDRVWPEMEKLVQEDLKDERLAQMLQQKPPELSKPLQDELEKMMKEAAENAAQAAEKTGEKADEQAEKDVDTLRKAAKKMREQGNGDPQSEQTAAEMEAKADELGKKAADKRTEAQKNRVDISAGKNPRPVPMGKLSKELREALEQAFKKLSAKERLALEQAAKRELEKIEDALNIELQGKLDPDKPKSHEERRMDEARERAKAEHLKQQREENKQEQEEIQRALEKEKTVYDRAYADVAPMVNLFADDLERLFLPQRHPRWRGHFPIGGRLDLRKAMQFEAKPETYNELWERKTIPHKRDFRFTLLVDLSGSMRGGGKIQETFKGVILLAEALSRVGMEIEILGFQDELIVFKSFGELMDDAVRSRMSGMPEEVWDKNVGGRNQSRYNDDGYVLSAASKRLKKQSGKDKFLIILSDGEPLPSPAHAGAAWDLKKIVAKIRAEKDLHLVGVGLGKDTEHVREYYPNATVVENVKELPRDLAALFEDIIKNPNTY